MSDFRIVAEAVWNVGKVVFFLVAIAIFFLSLIRAGKQMRGGR